MPGRSAQLGCMYYEGRGVPQDYKQAMFWYRKAADQGDAGAQNNLGLMYNKGRGVSQDYEKAYFWFLLSSAPGDAPAACIAQATQMRDLIAPHLTTEQRVSVQTAARNWRQQAPNVGQVKPAVLSIARSKLV
jgi:TPR repeat protein